MVPPAGRDKIASDWPRAAPAIHRTLLWAAAGIFLRVHHQRRHRTDQRSLRHAAFAVPSPIMGHLAAAGGMTNMHRVLQIKMRGQSRKVVGIMIHVVAVAGLGGPAVASSIMGDDAITVFE